MTKIEVLIRPNKNDLQDLNALLPQIARRPHFLTLKELARITRQKSCRLVVARSKVSGRFRVVGTATVTLVYIPTGLVAIIEDVVVDGNFRGRGIGRKLIGKLINIARRRRAKHISLYTNRDRRAANKMYQDMRFFKKDVNYYRLNLFLPKPAAKKQIAELLSKRRL